MRRFALLAGGILFPLVPLLFYFYGNFYDLTEPYSLSMIFGLISYVYFHEVLFIAGRISFLDRIFGQDRVMVYHRYLVAAALVTAFLHRQIKMSVFSYSSGQILLGSLAFLVFGTLSLASLFMVIPSRLGFLKKISPDYNLIKGLHNLLVLGLFLMSLHVFFASSTWETSSRLILAILIPLVSLGAWINLKFVRPLKGWQRGLVVGENRGLNDSIRQIGFKGNLPSFRAGQFGFFRFVDPSLSREEHPFSFSSAPEEVGGSITVKALGNYTRSLADLKPGTPVVLDGPYGRFTLEPDSDKPLIMIAGGIGITPFYSQLKSGELRNDREVLLIWAVKRREDLVYDEELIGLAQKKNLTYLPLIRHEEGKEVPTITAEFIKSHLNQPPLNYTAYFCGSPVMFKSLKREWKKLGILPRDVHYEKFSL
ncbi:MAG: hypothetical protein PQJ59_11680 [Spirochaetales bacterium]|nr:hypothetical protein [Spirochaetales bacterium]